MAKLAAARAHAEKLEWETALIGSNPYTSIHRALKRREKIMAAQSPKRRFDENGSIVGPSNAAHSCASRE